MKWQMKLYTFNDLQEVLAHLESALLQLIQDPSLADPPLPNSQLPPSMQGPPFGTPCDLPEVQLYLALQN